MANEDGNVVFLLVLQIVDEFIRSVEQISLHFVTATFEEKYAYLHICEDILAGYILIEREIDGDTGVTRLTGITTLTSNLQLVIQSLQDLIFMMEASVMRQHSMTGPGRPRLDISRQQLLFLQENDFNLTCMAYMLNCSVRTVQRRLLDHGISSRRQRYSITFQS